MNFKLGNHTAAKYLQEIKFFGASCLEKDLCMYAPTFSLEPWVMGMYFDAVVVEVKTFLFFFQIGSGHTVIINKQRRTEKTERNRHIDINKNS